MKAKSKDNPIGKKAKVPKGKIANTIPKTANTMAKTTNNFLIIYNLIGTRVTLGRFGFKISLTHFKKIGLDFEMRAGRFHRRPPETFLPNFSRITPKNVYSEPKYPSFIC